MNSSILKKVIEELGKEKPNLDYIRGMLETLAEMQDREELIEAYKNTHGEYPKKVLVPAEQFKQMESAPPADLDEGELLDAKARAMMPGVAAMAAKSTELG